jgi:hypothetical protein
VIENNSSLIIVYIFFFNFILTKTKRKSYDLSYKWLTFFVLRLFSYIALFLDCVWFKTHLCLIWYFFLGILFYFIFFYYCRPHFRSQFLSPFHSYTHILFSFLFFKYGVRANKSEYEFSHLVSQYGFSYELARSSDLEEKEKLGRLAASNYFIF